MDHVIAVGQPSGYPKIYRGPALRPLIRQVLLFEMDLSQMDLELAPDDFSYEVITCWQEPTLENLAGLLNPFSSHSYSGPGEGNDLV